MQVVRTLVGRRRGAGTALGLMLLALFVFGQAHTLVHHLVVEHHVCAQDGELAHGEHGHEVHGHEVHEVHHEEAEPDSGPALAANESDEEHGDHCSFLPSRDQRSQVPACSLNGIERSEVPEAGLALQSQVFESRIAVFRLAPKQSPPQVA